MSVWIAEGETIWDTSNIAVGIVCPPCRNWDRDLRISPLATPVLPSQDSSTVTRKFPVNSNGWNGEVDVQLSLFGLLLLTQPLNSSEQHTRANLEFSSNFDFYIHFIKGSSPSCPPPSLEHSTLFDFLRVGITVTHAIETIAFKLKWHLLLIKMVFLFSLHKSCFKKITSNYFVELQKLWQNFYLREMPREHF